MRWLVVSALSSCVCGAAALLPVTGYKPWPTHDPSTFGGETAPGSLNRGPQYYTPPQPIPPQPRYNPPEVVPVVGIRPNRIYHHGPRVPGREPKPPRAPLWASEPAPQR